ncbi:unnamed protein product [Discula destructiva]
MATTIAAPNLREILTPLLPSLPTAALSAQPAPGILRLLSPILRQRVQLLSSSSNDPWLRLLTYDKTKETRLSEVARSDRLEPHPVSGEVELDLDYDVQTQYRRLDKETLQALVVLKEFDLLFRLVYCVNDEVGGGNGWRVGEVSVPDEQNTFNAFAGSPTIVEAENAFLGKISFKAPSTPQILSSSHQAASQDDNEDDDDDYWARYDATPARTPQPKRSPAPGTSQQNHTRAAPHDEVDADDAYYAQYDDVQPAMDNHDPDEAEVAEQLAHSAPPPLGLQHSPIAAAASADPSDDTNELNGSWTLAPSPGARSRDEEARTFALAHPRPESSASSNGSHTVLKLEEQAVRHEQSEFGVKQHVSRSIRSLFLLSRASGIDREEFERMVKAELDVLAMVEDDL